MFSLVYLPGGIALYQAADGVSLPVDFPGEAIFEFSLQGEDFGVFRMESLPDGLVFSGLRESCDLIPANHYVAAAKGAELLHWDSQSVFCGRCGSRLHRSGPISKKCDTCGLEIFPQLSPAILVLVKRDDKALLVHARNFRRPFFGLVAGFVETGESMEECVAREVMEETSLRVRNIRYIGSQSWPFPANLMVGFTAEYAGGEVRFADGELSEGGFFSRDNLPEIPTRPSLARELIEMWVKREI